MEDEVHQWAVGSGTGMRGGAVFHSRSISAGLALPSFLFLAPLFLNAPGFRFPSSALRFQVSAFQHFRSLLRKPLAANRLLVGA